MRVPLDAGTELVSGKPQQVDIPELHDRLGRQYDVHPDGQRFVFLEVDEQVAVLIRTVGREPLPVGCVARVVPPSMRTRVSPDARS